MRRLLIIGSFLKQALQLIRKGEGTLHLFIWIDKWIVLLFTCTCFIECVYLWFWFCVYMYVFIYIKFIMFIGYICVFCCHKSYDLYDNQIILLIVISNFQAYDWTGHVFFFMCWCGLLYSLSKLIYVFVKILQVFI